MADAQKILVTGCSSGFGRLTAETLARQGHTVFATMRKPRGRNEDAAQALEAIAADEGLALRVLGLDVTSTKSVNRAVEKVLERSGRIDVAINNAGVMNLGVNEGFTPKQLARQLDVNVVGPFRVMRAVLPSMRERGSGLIVNVSSIAGRFTTPFFGLYGASKWGLEALSESFRYELATVGVDLAIVEPGPFGTELIPNSPTPKHEDRVAAYPDLGPKWEAMEAMFERALSDPEAPVDPQLVADAIADLVATPAGQRPLRTVVGLDFDVVRDLNAAIEPYRLKVLEALEMADLDGPAAAREEVGTA